MKKNKKVGIVDIIKSRYTKMNEEEVWREKRMEICNSCPLNSKNMDRTKWSQKLKDRVKLNHGKDTCSSCFCPIHAKTKVPHAVCGLEEIGQEPLWGAINTLVEDTSMTIENISTTPLKVSYKNKEHWLDYGNIEYKQETDVQLVIKPKTDNIRDINISASCGCTVPKLKLENNQLILTIQYDTKRVGPFTKTVVFSYVQNNRRLSKVFKITGKVEKK